MDPLSLTASIIAVIGAASATAQALEKLRSLRHAPQQILVVLNEVSDFRTVIVTLQTITQDLGEQKTDPKIIEHIESLIKKAEHILEKINTTLRTGLVKNFQHLGTEGIKISWRIWLRKQSRMLALVAHLAEVKKEITSALTVLIASEVPRVRIDLQSIAFNNREIGSSMEALENSTKSRLESMAEEVSTIQPSLNTLQAVLQQLQLAGQGAPTVAAPPYEIAETEKDAARSPIPSTFRIQTSLRRSCTDLCVCHCHKPTNINSPQNRWMKSLVGSLFIAYSGAPLAKHQPCTEKACLKDHQALLKVSYFFPSWFLGQRMVVLRDRFSPLDGHSISVRTPKILDGNDPAVWAVVHGNIESMRDLFSQGRASSFDLDDLGQSLLKIALSYKKLDVCKILLQSYANPDHTDITESLRYSIDTLWQFSLRDPSNKLNHELQRVFSHYLDPSENFRKRQFSTLHQIILGLSPLDLEEHLRASPELIDAKCSMGRTALCWAASRSDIVAVRTLLRYGARISVDKAGQTPIFHATKATGNSVEILEILLSVAAAVACEQPSYEMPDKFQDSSEHPLSDEISQWSDDIFDDIGEDAALKIPHPSVSALVNQSDNEGWTPLHYAALDNKYGRSLVLLSHGAEIDLPKPVLLLAIQFNGHDVLALLLSHGASTDAIDEEKQGVLHYAASFADYETLSILKALGTIWEGEMRDGRGETPLEVWEKWRAELIVEDENERARCWGVFENILANIEESKGKGKEVCNPEDKGNDLDELECEDDEDHFYDAEADIERIQVKWEAV